MVTDLQDNSQWRIWKEFIGESKAVTIASVALISSALGLLIAGLSMYNSTAASAKVDYEFPKMQDEIDQTRIRNDLYSIYMQELYVELKNQGFDPPPLPENE